MMSGNAAAPHNLPRARRLMPFVIWGSLAVGTVVLLLTGEAGSLIDALVHADWRIVAPLLLVAMALPVVHARRWQIMLQSLGHDLSLGAAVDLTISSTVINYTAPGYLWSPAKGLMARQMFGIGLGRSVPTLAAEQVLDALALMLGSLAGLIFAGSLISRAILDHLQAPSTGTMLILAAIVLLSLMFAVYIINRYARQFLSSVLEAGGMLVRDRTLRIPVIGWTATRWLLDTVAIWLAAKAVGVSLGLTALILISNLPLLIGLISPMPSGIGFREGAMAGVAGVMLLPVSVILAAAILHRAVLLIALPLVLAVIRLRRWAIA